MSPGCAQCSFSSFFRLLLICISVLVSAKCSFYIASSLWNESGKSYFIFTLAFLFALQLAFFLIYCSHRQLFFLRGSSTCVYICVHVRNIIVCFGFVPVSIESMLDLSDWGALRPFFIASPELFLNSTLIDCSFNFFSSYPYKWLLAMSHTIYSI